jgi:methylmalonyl-CoA mutase N-terminal domain/subunit
MYEVDFLEELRARLTEWEETTLKERLAKVEENKVEFTSGSGEFVTERIYTPLHTAEVNYNEDVGLPGQYPFTRGIDPVGYRAFRSPLGFYAGFGSGESANKRYRQLYAAGSRDIGLALDLPTQLGMDSDDLLAEGEVGKVGLAVDTVTDLERALKGIPLSGLKTGTVGNCIGPWALALFLVLCERACLQPSQMGVRLQNDPFKEYTGRGTFIFNPTVAVDLASDVVAYMYEYVPHWEPQWSCTTTMRWGGCTASQEVGFGIANLVCYAEAAQAKGVKPEDYIPRVDLHMSSDNDLFEEVAKFRAARRLWARIAEKRFKTRDPRILSLRISTYTAANRLTAREPLNNIIRSTLHVLASMLAGIDHITAAAYDEALALPTFESARLASLTKHILNHENCIGHTVDPLAGSYYLESLTTQVEEKARHWYEQIEGMGGAKAAIDSGYYLKEMARGQYQNQKEIENGERKVIGVNTFVLDKKASIPLFKGDSKGEAKQIGRLNEIRQKRDKGRATKSLDELSKRAEKKARGEEINIVPAMLEAVRAYATEGEIFAALRKVYGEYRPPAVF